MPLRLAARERRGRLAELQIAEPDVGETAAGARTACRRLAGGEALERLVDGERETVEDRQPVPLYAEHLFAEAAPVARVAGDGDVGEKVHLERRRALAAARLAAPPPFGAR